MDALKLLGSLLGNNATSSNIGNLVLGQLVKSFTSGGQAAGGGLGGLFGGTGNSNPFGAASGGGGASGMLGNLAMMALQMFSQRGGASGQSPLAALVNGLGFGQSPALGGAALAQPAGLDTQALQQAHQQALVLVQAMINAAKADGQIDPDEQQKIITRLGAVDTQEETFMRGELAKPLNFDFLGNVTKDLVPQVYAMSLMAINVDTPAEVQYLQQLAQSLGLDAQTVNSLHTQLGLQPLFG